MNLEELLPPVLEYFKNLEEPELELIDPDVLDVTTDDMYFKLIYVKEIRRVIPSSFAIKIHSDIAKRIEISCLPNELYISTITQYLQLPFEALNEYFSVDEDLRFQYDIQMKADTVLCIQCVEKILDILTKKYLQYFNINTL